jgi:hypothetical protein
MIQINVDTQEEKNQLLEASRHIHDSDIDTDLPMVNFIAHLYLSPDAITCKDKATNDRLDEVRDLAKLYAELEQRDNKEEKPERKRIASIAEGFNSLEMAYFCQQVISYYPDVHKACMCLTVLSNRIHRSA